MNMCCLHCGRLTYFSKMKTEVGGSAHSPFITLLPRHSQFGSDSLSGNGVWFTKSHIVLIISFLRVVLFTQLIVDKLKKRHAVSS